MSGRVRAAAPERLRSGLPESSLPGTGRHRAPRERLAGTRGVEEIRGVLDRDSPVPEILRPDHDRRAAAAVTQAAGARDQDLVTHTARLGQVLERPVELERAALAAARALGLGAAVVGADEDLTDGDRHEAKSIESAGASRLRGHRRCARRAVPSGVVLSGQTVAVRLLLNPASGRGRGARARSALEALCRRHAVELEETSAAEDLARRARRAAEEGIERLLVGGGDGTWHWAAQGLAGGETALAPIPLGTGNDLARELGFPLEAESAFAAALAGSRDRIDLGRIDLGPTDSRKAEERYFCGVAGVGFDAAVAQYARTRVKLLRGPLVYAWPRSPRSRASGRRP